MSGVRPAAFFDRDGVLNKDVGYLHAIKDLDLMPEAGEALAFLREEGFYIFVVTNQSGVARGLYDEAAVHTLHDEMQRCLALAGGHVDNFVYCPHLPDAPDPRYARHCACRKPKPGMLLDLMARYAVDRPRSFMIGDRPTDIAAAAGAGVLGYLYEGGSLLTFVQDVVLRRDR